MKYHEAKTDSDYLYISSLFRPENTQFLTVKSVSSEEIKKDHTEKRRYFIIEDAGQNIGYFNIYFSNDAKSARFGMIIDKPHQGKGYGDSVMEIIEQIAKDDGANKLIAEVFPDNKPAKKIYSHAGFKEIRTISYLEKEM